MKLAGKVGVALAARQLSLHEPQIYEYSKKDINTSQREQELAAEAAKLKYSWLNKQKS